MIPFPMQCYACRLIASHLYLMSYIVNETPEISLTLARRLTIFFRFCCLFCFVGFFCFCWKGKYYTIYIDLSQKKSQNVCLLWRATRNWQVIDTVLSDQFLEYEKFLLEDLTKYQRNRGRWENTQIRARGRVIFAKLIHIL